MIDAATIIVPRAWGLHERARDDNPHRQLMAAVLQTAVDDYWDSFCARSAGYGTLAARRRCHQARLYVLSEDRVWPFSFENLCDALDLDARTLRRALLWRAPAARLLGLEFTETECLAPAGSARTAEGGPQ